MSAWISVKDLLPNDRRQVLTYWAAENQIELQTFYLGHGGTGPIWMLFGRQNHSLESGRITHWMPLLEVPVKE
jgi:hypothetical protein